MTDILFSPSKLDSHQNPVVFPEAEFVRILAEFEHLPHSDARPPTIFELADLQQKEFVHSNLLRFFLDQHADHGFGDLFLNALVQVAKKEELNKYLPARNVQVTREAPTAAGKYLDLVVETEHFVLGIENKVNAPVNNPFTEYRDYLEARARESGKEFAAILLSLHEALDCSGLCGFTPVTYSALFKVLRNNLGARLAKANPKHVFYLLDFIATLENLKLEQIMDAKFAEFWDQHETIAKHLHTRAEELRREMKSRCKKIKEVTLPPGISGLDSRESSEPRNYFYWATDCQAFLGKGVVLGLEVGLRARGWQIFLYAYPQEDDSNPKRINQANERAAQFIRAAHISPIKKALHRWEVVEGREQLHEIEVSLDAKEEAGRIDVWTYAEYPYDENEATVRECFQELLNKVYGCLRSTGTPTKFRRLTPPTEIPDS